MLAITTYSTRNYAYALEAQLPLMVAALRYAEIPKAAFILAGDDSAEVAQASSKIKADLERIGVLFERIILDVGDNENGRHQAKSNLVIARLQNAAWHAARLHGAEQLWSLESDILPQPNTLRTMMDVLALDRGWYDVAFCTYPNAAFLGGRGSPSRWILPSIYEDERALPEDLQQRVRQRDERRKKLAAQHAAPTEDELHDWRQLNEAIEATPAKGNIWKLNGEKWRQRGWLESAYPGIGQGAVLPTDWVGLGCTLMSRRAFDLAHFTGYEGGCTQDLWLCWRAWQPMGIRMAVIPHALCSHVKMQRRENAPAVATIMHARHELGGECHGHLRSETREWCGI
jgi:hypothetical protein